MIEFIFGIVVGVLIGALACYAWQKGVLKDAGIK